MRMNDRLRPFLPTADAFRRRGHGGEMAFVRGAQGIKAAFCALVLAVLVIATPVASNSFAGDDVPVAPDFPETADATIELVSRNLLSGLQDLLSVYDESPEDFYAGIDTIVSPWIDYDSFYRGVMGRKYYRAASREQRDLFKEVFHQSLIETYGKGLLGIEETRFEVTPPRESARGARSVAVEQILFSGSGRVVVVYSMGQSADGRWRLKNVILEGINLGKTFRNQFARSAREHSEDLDLVIQRWASEG